MEAAPRCRRWHGSCAVGLLSDPPDNISDAVRPLVSESSTPETSRQRARLTRSRGRRHARTKKRHTDELVGIMCDFAVPFSIQRGLETRQTLPDGGDYKAYVVKRALWHPEKGHLTHSRLGFERHFLPKFENELWTQANLAQWLRCRYVPRLFARPRFRLLDHMRPGQVSLRAPFRSGPGCSHGLRTVVSELAPDSGNSYSHGIRQNSQIGVDSVHARIWRSGQLAGGERFGPEGWLLRLTYHSLKKNSRVPANCPGLARRE